MTLLKKILIKSFNFNKLECANHIGFGRYYSTTSKRIPTMTESIYSIIFI